MLPAVALVGRPNVGKSTLFNRLTGTRDALVADFPGLTRDRRYGIGRFGEGRFIAIDTGGLAPRGSSAVSDLVAERRPYPPEAARSSSTTARSHASASAPISAPR